ncbi:MAG TPA: MBL fold metallo-hydrolase, partial [bacterium]|nr:MBL fold metallo-hydrolase [bacterium]
MFAVETITTPGLAQNSYLIHSGGQGFVVDPRRDIDIYLQRLQELGLTLVGVAETHAHADFISGGRALAEATGAILYSPAVGDDV